MNLLERLGHKRLVVPHGLVLMPADNRFFGAVSIAIKPRFIDEIHLRVWNVSPKGGVGEGIINAAIKQMDIAA